MKVVINRCYGGFSLSKEAYEWMGVPYKEDWGYYHPSKDGELERTDDKLVACVEALGSKANGGNARLSIVEVPDDVDWYIESFDGFETVEEKHRSWH